MLTRTTILTFSNTDLLGTDTTRRGGAQNGIVNLSGAKNETQVTHSNVHIIHPFKGEHEKCYEFSSKK